MGDFQANDNNTCVVCFKNVLYYSIGECDHPVCYECSTRMRALCVQNECPICRQELSRVVFTDSIQLYKNLRNKVFKDDLFDRNYKIAFCNEELKEAFLSLLGHKCKICEKIPPFRSFAALSDHMRRVHERFFCDLCVKHLRIFTCERKCYTRQELAHHRRKGDVDDTSHRGHPLCEFCEDRFMDADDLYRHLRKEHLYCHLCDADGRNQYYPSHESLAKHFRTDHYLCEEGECADQHLTSVFRSEIDLRAHKASVHARGMARAATRQVRTLGLQFNITPHPGGQRVDTTVTPIAETSSPSPRIDTGSVEQFPSLSNNATAAPLLIAPPSRAYQGTSGLTRNDRNFPALDGASAASPQTTRTTTTPVAAAILKNSKPGVSIQVHSQPTSASNFRLTQTSGNRISIPQQQNKQTLSEDDFPSLSMPRDDHPSLGAGSLQPSKVSLISSQEMQSIKKPQDQQSKKSKLSAEAFPALSSTSVPVAPPQWITITKGKEKNKFKQETSLQSKPQAFNPISDFPTLAVRSKPKKQPQSSQPTPRQSDVPVKVNNKKEKKKQNSNLKKENIQDYSHLNGAVNDLRIDRDSYLTNNDDYTPTSADPKLTTIVEPSSSNPPKKKNNVDFSMKAKDYPPLCKGEPAPPTVNGNVKTGFAAKMQTRPAAEANMTFTNSAGETFPAPVHSYIPPPDFDERNRDLVNKFAFALGGTEALESFRVASRAFREDIISAEEFYENCRMVLGKKLDAIFPEMVALLPDIAKQQELVVGRPGRACLRVCSTCGQLLVPADAIAHDTAHWPALC